MGIFSVLLLSMDVYYRSCYFKYSSIPEKFSNDVKSVITRGGITLCQFLLPQDDTIWIFVEVLVETNAIFPAYFALCIAKLLLR